jgi:hypothetical protein
MPARRRFAGLLEFLALFAVQSISRLTRRFLDFARFGKLVLFLVELLGAVVAAL